MLNHKECLVASSRPLGQPLRWPDDQRLNAGDAVRRASDSWQTTDCQQATLEINVQPAFQFSDAKALDEIPMCLPRLGMPNTGVISEIASFRPVSCYSSETVQIGT